MYPPQSIVRFHKGPYDRIRSDEKGGKIYIYRKIISDVGLAETWGGEIYVEDNTRIDYWEFYADNNGVIYYYRYGSE